MNEAELARFGYNGMFASRDTIDEALEYVTKIGKACQHNTAVVTACMVYANTLVTTLYENGMLMPPDLLLALKPFLDCAEAQEKVNGNADKPDGAFVDSIAGTWLRVGNFRDLVKASNMGSLDTKPALDMMMEDRDLLLEQNKELSNALADLLSAQDVPEPNCSCHISPPCNDCVNYSGIREYIDYAEKVLKRSRRL